VLDKNGKLLEIITIPEAKELIDSGTASGGRLHACERLLVTTLMDNTLPSLPPQHISTVPL